MYVLDTVRCPEYCEVSPPSLSPIQEGFDEDSEEELNAVPGNKVFFVVVPLISG